MTAPGIPVALLPEVWCPLYVADAIADTSTHASSGPAVRGNAGSLYIKDSKMLRAV